MFSYAGIQLWSTSSKWYHVYSLCQILCTLLGFPPLSLPKAKNSQLCEAKPLNQMSQFLHYLCGLFLDSLQYVHISFVLGSPALNSTPTSEIWSHQGRIDRKIHLPWQHWPSCILEGCHPTLLQGRIAGLCSTCLQGIICLATLPGPEWSLLTCISSGPLLSHLGISFIFLPPAALAWFLYVGLDCSWALGSDPWESNSSTRLFSSVSQGIL